MGHLTAIFAALLGTLAGGFVHYWLAKRSAKVGRSSMRIALIAEVSVLRDLLRQQFDRDTTTDVGGPGPVAIFPIVYRGSLARVYDGLSDRLGGLDRPTADAVVRFHTLYKIVVGVSEQRGIDAVDRRMIDELLSLGDRIAADSRA